MNKAKQMMAEGKTIKEIDSAIKIDDSPFLKALDDLSEELDKDTLVRTEAMTGSIHNITYLLLISIPLTACLQRGVFIIFMIILKEPDSFRLFFDLTVDHSDNLCKI